MGFLVISRRTNERIFIGNDIEIVVSFIGRDKVDLAIQAPKDKYDIKRVPTLIEEEKDRGINPRYKS